MKVSFDRLAEAELIAATRYLDAERISLCALCVLLRLNCLGV